MKKLSSRLCTLATCGLLLCLPGAQAWAVYGDARPDAPELAQRGPLHVGVRTLDVVHHNQLDVLAATAQAPEPHSERALRLEVWYPAQLDGHAELTRYTDVLGAGANDPARPNTPFQFDGRALRNARPLAGQSWPVVILSHGYPGSRLQMSYLTEFLASHGYLVVAIDHPQSTRADKSGFASTLFNRALDDLFVLDEVERWNRTPASPFQGRVDIAHTALMGYSMGGYGIFNAMGAGLSAAGQKLLPTAAAAQARIARSADPRVKALVAFAPWGGQQGIFEPAGLAAIRTPTLFVAGDQDDIAGYQQGIRRWVEGETQAARYLLVYQNAHHNIAPNPPPPASQANPADFSAYAEPAWDSTRLNNINQHFVLAFLDQTLKGQDHSAYLTLIAHSNDGVWALDSQGQPTAAHTYWKGFKPRTAVGLEFYHFSAAQP